MSNESDNKITSKLLRRRAFLHGIVIPTTKTVFTGLLPVVFAYLMIYFVLTSTSKDAKFFIVSSFVLSSIFCWIFGWTFYTEGHLFVTQYLKSVYMDFCGEEAIRKWFSPSLKEISELIKHYDFVYSINITYRIMCVLIDWTIIKLFIDWSA